MKEIFSFHEPKRQRNERQGNKLKKLAGETPALPGFMVDEQFKRNWGLQSRFNHGV